MNNVKRFFLTSASAAFVSSCATMPGDNAALVADMPQEIAALLDAAPTTGTVLPITGNYKTDAQVVKADEIVFQGNATLEFTKLDYPFVAIETKRLRIQAPYDVVTITRLRTATGSAGVPVFRVVPCRGTLGRMCVVMTDRVNGASQQLPPLIIRAETVEAVGYEQNLQNFKVVIDMTGVDGGRGANGINGQPGGPGDVGRAGSDGIAYCRSGAGDGKPGRRGGGGRKGGNGGNGGKGGDVQLISNAAGLSLLTLADIRNRGGKGGAAGMGGKGGPGGPGGDGGMPSTYCGRGEKGRGGPPGPDGRAGENGRGGGAGVVTTTSI